MRIELEKVCAVYRLFLLQMFPWKLLAYHLKLTNVYLLVCVSQFENRWCRVKRYAAAQCCDTLQHWTQVGSIRSRPMICSFSCSLFCKQITFSGQAWTTVYNTGAQITILKGNAWSPPSTACEVTKLPTCSVANYVLPPCTVNSCLCTPCAVGSPGSASLCSEHANQRSYWRSGRQ